MNQAFQMLGGSVTKTAASAEPKLRKLYLCVRRRDKNHTLLDAVNLSSKKDSKLDEHDSETIGKQVIAELTGQFAGGIIKTGFLGEEECQTYERLIRENPGKEEKENDGTVIIECAWEENPANKNENIDKDLFYLSEVVLTGADEETRSLLTYKNIRRIYSPAQNKTFKFTSFVPEYFLLDIYTKEKEKNIQLYVHVKLVEHQYLGILNSYNEARSVKEKAEGIQQQINLLKKKDALSDEDQKTLEGLRKQRDQLTKEFQQNITSVYRENMAYRQKLHERPYFSDSRTNSWLLCCFYELELRICNSAWKLVENTDQILEHLDRAIEACGKGIRECQNKPHNGFLSTRLAFGLAGLKLFTPAKIQEYFQEQKEHLEKILEKKKPRKAEETQAAPADATPRRPSLTPP